MNYIANDTWDVFTTNQGESICKQYLSISTQLFIRQHNGIHNVAYPIGNLAIVLFVLLVKMRPNSLVHCFELLLPIIVPYNSQQSSKVALSHHFKLT